MATDPIGVTTTLVQLTPREASNGGARHGRAGRPTLPPPDAGGKNGSEELLQFFYQCPLGLLDIDERGTVRRIDTAAARS